MAFAELMNQVLRPFNRAGNQLRIKHHIERVDAKVPLGVLLAAIHLDRITHRLKRMERKSDRQKQSKIMHRIVHLEPSGDPSKIRVNKIKVFEKTEHSDICYDTQRKHPLPLGSSGSLDLNPGDIINDDRERENEDIARDERHVKNTTRQK